MTIFMENTFNLDILFVYKLIERDKIISYWKGNRLKSFTFNVLIGGKCFNMENHLLFATYE